MDTQGDHDKCVPDRQTCKQPASKSGEVTPKSSQTALRPLTPGWTAAASSLAHSPSMRQGQHAEARQARLHSSSAAYPRPGRAPMRQIGAPTTHHACTSEAPATHRGPQGRRHTSGTSARVCPLYGTCWQQPLGLPKWAQPWVDRCGGTAGALRALQAAPARAPAAPPSPPGRAAPAARLHLERLLRRLARRLLHLHPSHARRQRH